MILVYLYLLTSKFVVLTVEEHSMEGHSPDRNIAFSAPAPPTSADTLEPPTDPTVLIYSNALNMAIERLGTTLASTVGTAMANVADSMKHMTAAFEKQKRRQVYSSFEDTCAVGTLASRSCSQDGAEGKSPSFVEVTHEKEAPRSTSEGGAQYDFTVHGSKKPTDVVSSSPRHSTRSLTKWATKPDLALDSDDSPSKHSVISLEAGDVDEFDVAVQQLTTMPVLPPTSHPNGTPVDTLYNTYMEEYQPDSLLGPAVSDDLVRTVNLFVDKKLSAEKLKERRMREMRPDNIDLLMRTTNRTIFKLNCGDVSHARGINIKLQHVEQNVVKATYPIIRGVADLTVRTAHLKTSSRKVDGWCNPTYGYHPRVGTVQTGDL